MALINLARASELIPNFNTANNTVLSDCINAASAAVENYCNRTFELTTYDDVYDGTGYFNLILDQFPITQITRIAFYPVQVMQIRNSNTSVSKALVRLTDTALILAATLSGVETVRTLTRTSYLTFADLANAINGYSSDGWTASTVGPYSTWAVADLRAPQGGFDVRTGISYLKYHIYNLWDFDFNPDIGEVFCPFGFPVGYRNIRVLYSAGYATIPADLQQATAEVAVACFTARGTNANLQSENLSGYTYSSIAEKAIGNLSLASKLALEQYRNRRFARYKVMT